MSPISFDPTAGRAALEDLPELAAQESLQPPELTRVYVPLRHRKALSLDASVVVGMRGAGKSWWTAVLADDKLRKFVARQLGSLTLERVVVRVGLGLDDSGRDFPTSDTLKTLLETPVDPLDVWQTVVLRHMLLVASMPSPLLQMSDWSQRVKWLIEHRDLANEMLTDCDLKLADSGRILLIVFDAFDWLAGNWDQVRRLTRGALQLGLKLRTRRSIRMKFFLRPDFEEDEEIWQFTDSSKLQHARVDLAWTKADLYGLIFMHLGNSASFGETFREVTANVCRARWTEEQSVYLPPEQIRDDSAQRQIVEALADSTMGGGPRRGYTWSWVPLHLADAMGRISPRSYLLAFKRAAEVSADRFPTHRRALHYQAIQEGVVKASEIRVQEITEDYPWVRPLLEALRGAEVPMEVRDLSTRWSQDCLARMKRAAGARLPPSRFTNDPFRKGGTPALIDDLVSLAVLYRTEDGRLNMPDIFRVGFGIRRRGGVRPPR